MRPWDRTVDFLVVGSGAAGMTGALRADDLCGETLVIEKAPVYGGSTALSGGVVWVPNNPGMKGHGVSDSPEEALAYLAPFPSAAPAWIMIFEKNLPGSIIVNKNGRRFMNEAAPYNDVVKSMYKANKAEAPTIPATFIFDSTYRWKYPCGPMPPRYAAPDGLLREDLKKNYFRKDRSLEGLAQKIGVDVKGLVDTVRRLNQYAATGKDPGFGRGDSLQDRYYTGKAKSPNPTLGPIERPPFYAVRVFPGDLGTKGGFRTDAHARVLTDAGEPIPGLCAAGNCSASVMGTTYPGAGATIGPAMTFGFISAEHALGAGAT